MKFHKWAVAAALLIIMVSLAALAGCAAYSGEAGDNSQTPSQVSGDSRSSIAQPVVKSAYDIQEDNGSPAAQRGSTNHPDPQPGPPPSEAKTPIKGKKVAYLTFDDGPNSDYTEKVLDLLRTKKVKASFMVVGKNVMLNPRVLQRILADGHAVINHTYSHDYNIIYRSPKALVADLDENNNVIKRYTGKPVMLFRAPGGPDRLNKEFMSALRARGYIHIGWNISAVDSDPYGVTREQVYNNIASGLERVEMLNLTPIILMHDGTQLATTVAKPGTPLATYIQNRESSLGALPAVIDHFTSKGYTFVVVDSKTPAPWN